MAKNDDIAVLTSENVRLTYTLAGLGSRIVSFIIDVIIIGLIGFVVTWIFIRTGFDLMELGEVDVENMSMLAAIYIGAMTLLFWGYFFLFEWINWGQTPGKMVMNIRVSMADGAPVETVACAVRNVIRIVDLFLAAVGITIFIMIFTPRYQRLGDLAAGTVVVRRRSLSFDEILNAARESDRALELALKTRRNGNMRIRISDTEKTLLEKFIARREALPPKVRKQLAGDFAGKLRSRDPSDELGEMDDEEVIEAVLASVPIRNN